MCLSCSTAANLVKFSLVHGETKMEFGIVLIKEGEAEINTNPVNLSLCGRRKRSIPHPLRRPV